MIWLTIVLVHPDRCFPGSGQCIVYWTLFRKKNRWKLVSYPNKYNPAMAKHHPDLIFCRKQPGVGKLSSFYDHCLNSACWPTRLLSAIGRLCEKCDGKCVICDSYVRPCTLVRICDECNYGSYQGRCVICGGPGVSDAYYCKECTIQEKDVCFVQ